MKETKCISALMLERYNLGEVTARERKLVETELSSNMELRSRYDALINSDRELRARYAWEQNFINIR